MDKHKIRLVITALAPMASNYSGKSGGAVRLFEILKRLKDLEKTEVCVITSNEYYADYFRNNGVEAEFRLVNSNLKFKNLLGLCLKSLLNIAKAFLVLNLDFLEIRDRKVVLYSTSDLFWEVIPNFLFKLKRNNAEWVQAIYHIYPDWKTRPGSKISGFFGFYLQRFSFLLIKKKADKILLINRLTKEALKNMGFSENKMYISACGIDTEYFENLEKSALAYDGVFLARLSPSKGTTDLVKIWKKVCQEIPQARLAVIGGGRKETKEILQRKINEFGLKENIDLLGFLEDSKAYSILKSGKLFLFPSHEEGWGIAIAEAMACGLPVVSWDLPVYRDIFENYIIQTKENNIEKISSDVVDLLKNEKMRIEVGEKGKEYIKKYSWDKIAKEELEIMRS